MERRAPLDIAESILLATGSCEEHDELTEECVGDQGRHLLVMCH